MRVIYINDKGKYLALDDEEFAKDVQIKNYEDYGSYCEYEAYYKGKEVDVIDSLTREESFDDAFEYADLIVWQLAKKYQMSDEDKEEISNIFKVLDALKDKEYE